MSEHTCYAEPFVGSGAVFFAKAPVACEVLNNFDEEIANFYGVLQTRRQAFVRRLSAMPHSRALYDRLKHQKLPRRDAIGRAARLWYLQRMGYSGKVRGRVFGYSRTDHMRQHPALTAKDLQEASERLHQVTLECGPWQDVLRRYDSAETLFYCDPPYWAMPYYEHNFLEADHAELAKALERIRGKFLLSYNDVPQIRALYTWAHIEIFDVPYATGLTRGRTGELLISNYDTSRYSGVAIASN